MFDRTADPIANVPVYKRIGIEAHEPQPDPAGQAGIKSTAQICRELTERHEANRIWELVRQASEGNG